MSTISQVVDRAQLIAMEGQSSSKYDSDYIAELLYPGVMKKVIIDAGNDPFRQKDVRITQNISVTSGVGTLPTNVALECLETANVQYAGAATWATSDVAVASVTVASAGSSALNGVYTARGVDSGYIYFALTGQATPTPPLILPAYSVFTDGNYWYTTNSSGDLFYSGRQTSLTGAVSAYPWDVNWSVYPGGGTAPAPTVTETAATSTITFTGHAFTTGEQVTLSTSGTLPSPFVVNTAYFVIVVDDNTIRLATSYANAIAGTYIRIASVGAGTGTITPQTLPPASYVRDYNDYLRPLPDIFSYWTTQGGSFYYRLIPPADSRARAAFTGTIPFNSVVFPIVSSNEVSIVAGTSLASDIVDDIVTALASAIRGEVSLASQVEANP